MYMKYIENTIEDILKPPSVITLNKAAAMMRRHTQTVTILVMMSILMVHVGIAGTISIDI